MFIGVKMAREKSSHHPYDKKILPGVRGKALRKIKITDELTIQKGSPIIIQPLETEKSPQSGQRFNITTFLPDDSKKSDLPESQRNIKVGPSYTVHINKPEKAFLFEEHYQLSKDPLFPENSPSLQDISQNQIPNCFLLASIQAILNHQNGAAFIRGMMKQQQDGTITVRLFDPKTAEPVFINVIPAILVDKKGPINAHEALWVHVLETAYASMGRGHTGTVDASASSVFSGGGSTSTAMSILTGFAQTKRIDLTKKDDLSTFRIEKSEIGQIESMRVFSDDLLPQAKKDTIFKAVLLTKLNFLTHEGIYTDKEKAFSDYMNYFDFYKEHKVKCDQILQEDSDDISKINKFINLTWAETTQTNDYDGASNLFKQTLNSLNVPINENTVRGSVPAFSGFYTAQQHQAYNNMEEALKNYQLITCDTLTKFNKPVPGLRSEHSYTVLEVFKRIEKAGEKEIPVFYVKLRNPWGSTGRVYNQKENSLEFSPEEDINAVFNVELSDFCNYFCQIAISPSVFNLLQYDKQQLELRESIKDIQHFFSTNKQITISNLLSYKENYDNYEQNLINLETLHLQTLAPAKLADIKVPAAVIFSSQNISEAEKKQILINIMTESGLKPPFYAGREEQKYLQLYNLLKLSWLKEQENPDNKAIKEVESNIVENAAYEFSTDMKLVKLALDLYTNNFGQNLTIEFAQIKKLIESMKEQVITTRPETFPQLKEALQNLYIAQLKIVNQSTFLKKLGIDFDTKLDKISTDILNIEKIVEKFPGYEALHQEFEARINEASKAISEAFGEDVLDIRQTKKIEHLINSIQADTRSSEDLRQITNELKLLNQPEQKKLAGTLEQLLAAAQALVDYVVNIIAESFEFLFTKNKDNGYFIEKPNEIKEEIYIGPFLRA